MKKLLLILGLGTFALADQFILTLDNIQSIKKMYCDKGYYKVIAEVDDNVEPIQLYKIENGKQVPAKCGQKQQEHVNEEKVKNKGK